MRKVTVLLLTLSIAFCSLSYISCGNSDDSFYSLENHSADKWVEEGDYVSIYCSECNELICKGKPNYDLVFRLNEEETAYSVVGAGKGAENEIIIVPQTYQGLPVTEVRYLSPESYIEWDTIKTKESKIKTVFIPPSVTYLGYFSLCDKLETIFISSGVTEMEEDVFKHNNSLKNIFVSNSNPSYKSEGGTLYTKDGSKLIRYAAKNESTEFTVPNSVTVIAENAFCDATSLKSVTFGESIKSIGRNAFNGCSSLEEIEITDSIVSIGSGAFINCTSLKRVSIGSGVEELGSLAFNGCKSLENIAVDQNNLYFSAIDDNLYDKDGATLIRYAIGNTQNSFSIPNGVITIGKFSFEGAEHLKEIILPETVTTIKSNAFDDCLSLEIIHLPTSLTKIEENTFDWLTKIKEVHIKSLSSWFEVDCEGLYSSPFCDSADLYVNGELLEHLDVPSYISEIPQHAFSGCQSIKTVTISGSTQRIGQSAFFGCKSIEVVDMKDGVKQIEGSAFYGCSSLKEVNIPMSITYIGNYAFYKCTSLKSLELPYHILVKIDIDRIFSNTP